MPKRNLNKDFRAIEDRIRAELEGKIHDPSNASREMQRIPDGLPAEVDRLHELYLNDRNPVRVFDAILQLHSEARIKTKPLVLPSWVLAYLVNVSQGILGLVVNRPELPQAGPDAGRKIRKSRTPPPVHNADGTVSRYSDWFGGCTAAERMKLANEILGFTGPKGGSNAFVRAHREQKEEGLVKRSSELGREGLTDAAAAKQIDDFQLRKVGDPVRKLRRIRKKFRQAPKLA